MRPYPVKFFFCKVSAASQLNIDVVTHAPSFGGASVGPVVCCLNSSLRLSYPLLLY